MPRGKPHPPDIRAQAVAAVALGESIPSVAQRLGLSTGTIKGWWAEDRPVQPALARTREEMAELIYDTIRDLLTAVRGQLLAVKSDPWLSTQNAGDVASLLDREVDGAIRLLSGFRPAESGTGPDAIDGPDIVDGAARATNDGIGV